MSSRLHFGIMWGWARIVFTLGACGIAAAAHAMSVRAPHFEDLVGGAEQILRVEVTDVTSRWDEGAERRVIHTYVSGRVLRTLKGAEQAEVTLRFLGGRVGRARMEVVDMPLFEVGKTYIVFVKDNGAAFCPLMAVMHGSYRVELDTATGRDRVVRSDGHPVAGVQSPSSAIMVSPRAGTAALAGSTATSLEEFESAIVNQVTHAPRRN